jgi:long-chain acyl-CoA synthetase
LLSARESFRRHGILLTGANGFLGKVILALLAARFPDFGRLYLLLRPKRRLSPEERFEKEVFASPPIQAISNDEAARQAIGRVQVLAGDVGQPGCGLDEETVQALAGRVDLIINCAGLVDFYPPVDESFQSNVDGVEHVLELARALGAKLLHVSTCFVCGEADGLVEESEPILGFYPRRKGPNDLGFRHDREIRYMRERIREAYAAAGVNGSSRRPRELAQRLSDLGAQRAAQWGWTNTYTYTKSLGEQIIAAADDVGWAIVRPAIVEAALEFPFPGWVEGGRTAAPLVMMAVAGLRHWSIREDAPMEVIPVDLVASGILIVAALLLNGRAERVYHLSTADVNPIYFGPLVRMLYREYRRQAAVNGARFRPWRWWPAGVRVLSPEQASARGRRQQQVLNRLQSLANALRRKLQAAGLPGEQALRNLSATLRTAGLRIMIRDQALELYRPFMYDNRFIFEAENIRTACAMLAEEDRRLLPWNPEQIDWRRYWIQNEVEGVRRWVQNEPGRK